MTTFNLWLEAQAGRGDDLGVVALTWVDAKGIRPKRFGTESVLTWLREQVATIKLPEDRALAAIAAARAQFHEVQGNLQAVPLVAPLVGQSPAGEPAKLSAVPDQPLPAPPGPQARQIAEAHGWIPPGSPGPAVTYEDQLAQRLEALERTVGERLGEIAAILRELAPLVVLAREVGEATADQPAEDADPMALLEEGLEQPPAGSAASLYGGHVIPREAAWEAAWQEGSPEAAG